ncbi:MAG: hypothetical protein OXC26_00600 [Albidovulum sp.]|nr:hypothetical protein [Albidovulum sp.]
MAHRFSGRLHQAAARVLIGLASLGAGLNSAEMRVPGGPPIFAPSSEGDLSTGGMSPNVAFDAIR